MLDPRIAKDPVSFIRRKNNDGTFLFSKEECERWIELVLFDRAMALWARERPPELARGEKTGTGGFWKPSGRGKTFWVDSE